MELLLVLTVIVALVAMAIPSFRSSLQVERLRRAADTIRIEWTRARVKAMKSGFTQAFLLSPSSGQFMTAPFAPNLDEVDDDRQALLSEAQATTSAFQSSGQLPDGTGDQLPEGVTFLDASVTEDGNQNTAAAGGAGAASAAIPVLFYADGTTSNAYVTVGNERNEAITISLRGLTGAVQVGLIESRGGQP